MVLVAKLVDAQDCGSCVFEKGVRVQVPSFTPKVFCMNSLKIIDSFNIWSIEQMSKLIDLQLLEKFGSLNVEEILNRPRFTLYIEWWLHNIGYYATLFFDFLEHYNLRFKDVDLQAWTDFLSMF